MAFPSKKLFVPRTLLLVKHTCFEEFNTRLEGRPIHLI